MASMNEILNLRSLPPVPAALGRALSVLLDPASDWAALEKAVRPDPALTAAVLRLANSVRFGVPGRQFDLRASMSRLGRDNLRHCVLEQQVGGVINGANAAFGLQRGALWRSSLGGAIAAEDLARNHAPKDAGLAFVCGLLRDLGKLALDAQYGEAYWEEVSRQRTPGRPFIEAERAALGFDHSQIGAALARKWQLPERIARAIETHHAPPPIGPDHDTLFDIVHAADVVARWAGLGVGMDGLEYTLAEHVRESLHLDRRSAERQIVLVWEKLREEEELQGMTERQGVAA
jgi:putative nucleotidyltransferase with HDIG domain